MKKILLMFFLIKSIFLMAQKDSISHIYFGISAIPIAPIFHFVEDTTWYITRYSPGGSIGGELIKTHSRPDFNLSSGYMLFVSFNHFFDLSSGWLVDLKPYEHYDYTNNNKTKSKNITFRYPINLRFSIFKPRILQYHIQCGITYLHVGTIYYDQKEIYEGLGHGGVGLSLMRHNFSLNGDVDFSFYKVRTFAGNSNLVSGKVFTSAMLTFSFSYSIF